MWNSIKRYHFFYYRKGFYKFLGQISVKFAAIMVAVVLAMLAFETYTPGIAYYFAQFSAVVSKEIVIGFFFLSETLLGLVPPDLFIIWAEQFSSPYAVVGLLAVLSYAAGLLSYYMGVRLVRWKRVSDYVDLKFGKHFKMLRSWGGFIIVIAALFPLPFSTMCLGAGIMRYSFISLLVLGLFRIARFYIYAAFLFQMV
jgi:membrane protein YqaA with SNARE-associated domain